MANGVTTEWYDIHVKNGNFIPEEKLPTGEELFTDNLNFMEGYEHEKKQDSDDDFNDDFLEEYRKRRLEELKGAEIAGRYTYVKQITKEDFRIEVTDAPKGLWVVLLLY